MPQAGFKIKNPQPIEIVSEARKTIEASQPGLLLRQHCTKSAAAQDAHREAKGLAARHLLRARNS